MGRRRLPASAVSGGCAFLRMDGTLVEFSAAFYDPLGMGHHDVVGRTIFTIWRQTIKKCNFKLHSDRIVENSQSF